MAKRPQQGNKKKKHFKEKIKLLIRKITFLNIR